MMVVGGVLAWLVGAVVAAHGEWKTINLVWDKCVCASGDVEIDFSSDHSSMPECAFEPVSFTDPLPMGAMVTAFSLTPHGCSVECGCTWMFARWYLNATQLCGHGFAPICLDDNCCNLLHANRTMTLREAPSGWWDSYWVHGGTNTIAIDFSPTFDRGFMLSSLALGIEYTMRPLVTDISVSDSVITEQMAGRTFTITVSFSEVMTRDGTGDPLLSFSPAVPRTLYFFSDNWENDHTYAASFLVSDNEVDHDSVAIRVSQARRADGLEQLEHTSLNAFGIDTRGPLLPPSGMKPADGSYTRDTTPTISWDDAGGEAVLYYRYTEYVELANTEGYVTTGTSYSCTAYSPSYMLKWKVRAVDEHLNASPWSPLYTLCVDSVAPEIDGCPADIELDTVPGASDAQVWWTEPTATDDLSGIDSFTCSHESGDRYPVGTTTVEYVAVDAAGNSSTCSFRIIVRATLAVTGASDLPGGSTGFLDRAWTEDEEPPVVGEMQVSAAYEPGETVAGSCAATGDVSYLTLTWYAVTIGEEYDVREPIDSNLVHAGSDGRFFFEIDTEGWSPGYYDMRIGIPGEGCVWIRVEVVPPAE